ncbi:baseplate assembly protein [Pasteurella bettyae]|uniref:Baseplate J-like protein n=1 Tax=Pasteurella bettyae CCUG 2042 TaxID=1095749 RepID=I3DCC0_9PAST|nr:baseplate J/gp47 family protein [Pasteurella bettyae]EIJ69363.1 baseplate J-like protein [Pasteurella bettyae CCUG 2042]SUB20770.1 Uncharacterized homolog of phage Mu protein gp47 [Pasteurella bettyae]SUB21313.1 Uncharacterized homolog of phage Mu protein gp47 [Pasteurella bettyae]
MSEIVDLSKLDAPNVLEDLDFEQLLEERKARFISLYPDNEKAFWTKRLSLESEPIVKLLEENCYMQLQERQRINEAAKATMLAYATGSDLDVIAANFNVKRLVIQPADNAVTPAISEILESDEELRLRCQLAFEGLSTAGPRASYIFHALSAHADVADVSVISPSPANVTVTVLSRNDDGVASKELLNTVAKALNDDSVRPIADRVLVQSASITEYQINAKVYLYKGPEAEPIKNQILSRLNKYVKERRRLGRDITLSSIYAVIHTEGVQRVELLNPTKDILLDDTKATKCTALNIEVKISDDQ